MLSKKELQINFRDAIKHHFEKYMLIPLSIGIVALPFDSIISLSFISYWTLDILITVFLICIYYELNKEERYIINPERIIRYKKGIKEVVEKADIKSVDIYISPGLLKNYPRYSFIKCHYTKVSTKKGEEFYITSFLGPRVDRYFHTFYKDKVRMHRKVFCLVGW